MSDSGRYQGWHYVSFWLLWVLLLFPAYCAAFGTWMVGSMLPGFHEPIDIILTAIFFVTLLLIMAVAVFTAWGFLHRTQSYRRLVLFVLGGVLCIPFLSIAVALTFYIQLNNISIALK